MANSSVLSASAAIVDPATGRPTPEFYRLIVALSATADGASAGEVATEPGSGLAGGGTVSDGVALSIADNGVSNSKIRQSTGTSVIGRSASSTGNVADIKAGLNNTVLYRGGNQLYFSNTLAGLTFDNLRVQTTATTSTATVSHSIAVEANGVTYYLLASTTP